MKRLISYLKPTVLLLFIVAHIVVIGQPCTTCPEDCSTGCDWTVSSSSSTDYDIGSGEKLCITGGTYTGNITFTANGTVCVSGGSFNPASIDAGLGDHGTIQIGASASATLPAISFSSSRGLTINNCGSITHSGDMTRGGNGNFFYNNNGTVDFGANVVDFYGTATDNAICNDGSWTSGNVEVSGDLTNYDSMWVATLDVDGILTNETTGYIEGTGNLIVRTGATVNQKGRIEFASGELNFSGSAFNAYDGSLTIVNDFAASGSGAITGVTNCGAIRVTNNSSFTGTVILTGSVDLCDRSGTAPTRAGTTGDPKVDSYSGTNVPFGGSVTYCTCDVIFLPIELVSFDAYPKKNIVELEWNTLMEINNDYFTVLKSKNAVDWEEVTTVAGAGNSSQSLFYSTTDKNPFFGTSYYRLKQTDFDGRFEYFPVIAVNISNQKIITVYPNPAKNTITVAGDAAELQNMVLINYLGQNVTPSITILEETNTKKHIDISTLATGVYFLKTKTMISKIHKK